MARTSEHAPSWAPDQHGLLGSLVLLPCLHMPQAGVFHFLSWSAFLLFISAKACKCQDVAACSGPLRAEEEPVQVLREAIRAAFLEER